MTRRALRCATGVDLERAQADGSITVEDADEVRRFAAYLRAVSLETTDAERARVYLEHYPEHAPPDPPNA